MAALGKCGKVQVRGQKSLLYYAGTGVGGGVIANGQVVHGKSGAAGEIGHLTV